MSTTEETNQETNPTEVCENCGKDIESYKMVLHERFCKINIRKCDICKEPIQIDELEEHKIMKHQKQKCPDCGQSFLLPELKTHKCPKKMVECQYCGLFVDKNELNDHEYQCGAKSIPCEYCGINVPAMEKALHLKYTCTIKAAFDKNDNNPIKEETNEINNINNINNQNNSKALRVADIIMKLNSNDILYDIISQLYSKEILEQLMSPNVDINLIKP